MATDREVLTKLYQILIEKRKDALDFAEETDRYFTEHPAADAGYKRLTVCPPAVADDPNELLRFFTDDAPPETALFYNMALSETFLKGQDFGEALNFVRALLKMGYYAALRDIEREDLII